MAAAPTIVPPGTAAMCRPAEERTGRADAARQNALARASSSLSLAGCADGVAAPDPSSRADRIAQQIASGLHADGSRRIAMIARATVRTYKRSAGRISRLAVPHDRDLLEAVGRPCSRA